MIGEAVGIEFLGHGVVFDFALLPPILGRGGSYGDGSLGILSGFERRVDLMDCQLPDRGAFCVHGSDE